MFNPLDRSQTEPPRDIATAFWARPVSELLQALDTSQQGLTANTVREKLEQIAQASSKGSTHYSTIRLLLSQFQSPITLILIAAAMLSFFLNDMLDAAIVLGIVLVSAILGFFQEHSATNAVRKLLELVTTTSTVIRAGAEVVIEQSEVVPGDIIRLSAGDTIPADCRLMDCRDLFVDEAALTGETFPVEKAVTEVKEDCALSGRINSLWQGTHVVSGSGLAVAVVTGDRTQFGAISQRLKFRPPETDFEKGVRKFGYLLMEFTLLLVGGIFFVNVYFERPVIDAFLFSLALAVGLTPQLLPAIITVNLSFGARRMAEQEVIVKRLSSIENFGSMNVLCSDKTGTLTEGTAQVDSAVDAKGTASYKALQYAFINAAFETGFVNPIDSAIRTTKACDLSKLRKLDEIPYDFIRRRLSVLIAMDDDTLLITKGSVDNILEICDSVELADGSIQPIEDLRETIQSNYTAFGHSGKRTLGVAYRRELGNQVVDKSSEKGMTFIGFLLLEDPLKANIVETIKSLSSLGIGLKVITGDNRRVASSLADRVGLSVEGMLCGKDLYAISDEALVRLVGGTQVFAEIEPNQKERIILACKKAGNVVGYMGDGINDATALHAADVGISVNQAVDVAKEAADIVLLKHDLGVLVDGVREGRKTFANTMKYIFMATSANFGNMFSMAGSSLFLSFLPLLPKQILLLNLLTDLPQMSIASDSIDDEMISQPQRWDIGFIRRFMIVFGIISSFFDFLTFFVLLQFLSASEEQFRTAWFVESAVSAMLVVLVVRTRRPLLRSHPSKALLFSSMLTAIAALAAPWWPWSRSLGFAPLPISYLACIAMIVAGYVITAEMAKARIYRKLTGSTK